ncbi:DUF4265 domain-containing protein [Ralstonia solanacearum]
MEADLHNLVDEREGVFKVVVSLPEDAWHNFSSELLWAEALEDGTMRVLNTPFFAKGLSYQDVISIKVESDGIFSTQSYRAGDTPPIVSFGMSLSMTKFSREGGVAWPS